MMSENRQSVVLHEGHPRGFLSNYLTVLTGIRYFMRRGIPAENIHVSGLMFSMYGNPKNWFAENRVSDRVDAIRVDATTTHVENDWSKEELDSAKTVLPYHLLSDVRKHFPYNSRVTEYINTMSMPEKCLAIHYRGTDHPNAHSKAVDISEYESAIDQAIQNDGYKTLFVCGDEAAMINRITAYCKSNYGGISIITNDFIRSETKIPIHKLNLSSADKIRTGDQVLMDTHCISKCHAVICRDSNIINYASVLNPLLDIKYMEK